MCCRALPTSRCQLRLGRGSNKVIRAAHSLHCRAYASDLLKSERVYPVSA